MKARKAVVMQGNVLSTGNVGRLRRQCPRCGAKPGFACTRMNSAGYREQLKSVHKERFSA